MALERNGEVRIARIYIDREKMDRVIRSFRTLLAKARHLVDVVRRTYRSIPVAGKPCQMGYSARTFLSTSDTVDYFQDMLHAQSKCVLTTPCYEAA